MKRVLMISYYFPPMGMSGVQRTLKFAKYLPCYGWQPHILTVSTPSYFAFDVSLLDELSDSTLVHRTGSWDVLSLLDSFGRGQPSIHSGQSVDPPERLRALLSLCSQALFQPDNKMGWLPFALRKGMRLVAKDSFDLIYSSAPPYTDHLVGLALKSLSKRPLVVDFRDAWTQNPLHTYVTPVHLWMNQFLEREVLRQADAVVSINEYIQNGLCRSCSSAHIPKFSVVSHGFDPEDFQSSDRELPPARDVFTITYSGTFYGARTPRYFLQALRLLLDETPEVRGKVRAVFVGVFRKGNERLVRDLHLGDVVQVVPYTEHRQSISHLVSSHLLWMTVAEGPTISTSKLYEYIGARKPILACVPPDGAAAGVVRGLGDGTVVAPEDVRGIKEALLRYYRQFSATGCPSPDAQIAAKYDRRLLAGQLANIFDRALTRAV
jgi:glycosyltransferase involved in cell wall biosynthesis